MGLVVAASRSHDRIERVSEKWDRPQSVTAAD
jgi:hypothetical protein